MILENSQKIDFTNKYGHAFNLELSEPIEKIKGKYLIVFNNGLLCGHAWWYYTARFLSEHHYPILLYQYRAHLTREILEESEYSFEKLAFDLESILDHLNIKKIILIGHSMGVNVCLEFAKMFPKQVQAMVLISGTALPPLDFMFNSGHMKYVFHFAKKIIERIPSTFDKIWKTTNKNPLSINMIHKFGVNSKVVSKNLVKRYLKEMNEMPHELLFIMLYKMNSHEIIYDLSKIKTPSLIIGGTKDLICPITLQLSMHKRMDNSEFYEVPEGSHVPQIDYPRLVNERILLFLTKSIKKSK
ncbi:MAG: alpha/beta hydrolase [Bacteriovoracaceae bacterium]